MSAQTAFALLLVLVSAWWLLGRALRRARPASDPCASCRGRTSSPCAGCPPGPR